MTFEELKQLANKITKDEQAIAQVSNFLLQVEEFRVQLVTLREKLDSSKDGSICLIEEVQQKIQALHVLQKDIINIYDKFSNEIKERLEIKDIITKIKEYNVSQLDVKPIATIYEIIQLAEDPKINAQKIAKDIAKDFRDFLQQKYQQPLLEQTSVEEKENTIVNNNVHLLILLSKYHQQDAEYDLNDRKSMLFSKINDLYETLSKEYPHMLDTYNILKEKVNNEFLEKNKNEYRNAIKKNIFDNPDTNEYIKDIKQSLVEQKNSLFEDSLEEYTKNEKILFLRKQSLVGYQNIATENTTQLEEIEKGSCAEMLKNGLNANDINNDLAATDINQKIKEVYEKKLKKIGKDAFDKLEKIYKKLKIIQTQGEPIDKITLGNIFFIIFDNTVQIPQSIAKDWGIFKQSIESLTLSLDGKLDQLTKIRDKIRNKIQTIQDQIQPLNQEQQQPQQQAQAQPQAQAQAQAQAQPQLQQQEQQPNNLIQPNADIQEQPQQQPQPQDRPEGQGQPQQQAQPQAQQQAQQQEQQKQQEELKQLQNIADKLNQVQDAVRNEKNALTYPEILEQCLQVSENAPQNIKSELEPLLQIDDVAQKLSQTLQKQEEPEIKRKEEEREIQRKEIQQKADNILLPNQLEEIISKLQNQQAQQKQEQQEQQDNNSQPIANQQEEEQEIQRKEEKLEIQQKADEILLPNKLEEIISQLKKQEEEQEIQRKEEKLEIQQKAENILLPNQLKEIISQLQNQQSDQPITKDIIENAKQQAKDYINSIIDKIKQINYKELTKQQKVIEDKLIENYKELSNYTDLFNKRNSDNEPIINVTVGLTITMLDSFNKKVANTIKGVIKINKQDNNNDIIENAKQEAIKQAGNYIESIIDRIENKKIQDEELTKQPAAIKTQLLSGAYAQLMRELNNVNDSDELLETLKNFNEGVANTINGVIKINQQDNNNQPIISDIIAKAKQQAEDYINSIINKINNIPDEELTKNLATTAIIDLQFEYNNLLPKLDNMQNSNELRTNKFNEKVAKTINNFNKTVVDTINSLIEAKELYGYLMYIKSHLPNIKDLWLSNHIANTLKQLTPDTLTVADIESTAQDVVQILQQYIKQNCDINGGELSRYLIYNLQVIDKLEEKTILKAIRSYINIIDKISKNTDKAQAEEANDVLEQMSTDLCEIIQEEEPKEIDRINIELQQLHQYLKDTTRNFSLFYHNSISSIIQELEAQRVLAKSLKEIRNRTQADEDRLNEINNTIKELEARYKELGTERKKLQNDLYQYWLKITEETLIEKNYPDDKPLIQTIKNKIKDLKDSENWDEQRFTNYTFYYLQIITENIEELSNAKKLYDDLTYINTKIKNIKDKELKKKLEALNIDQLSREWKDETMWKNNTIRSKLNDVALKFIMTTKQCIEDKIKKSKNATLKAKAEQILSPLNDFNPRLDKQWLRTTIDKIITQTQTYIRSIMDPTLKQQTSFFLEECIIPNLDITKISNLNHLNDVKRKIALNINSIQNDNLKENLIKNLLEPLYNPICNIEDINSIIKTKLPKTIEMMHEVSETIKLVPDKDEKEKLNNFQDQLKAAEQVFQVPGPQLLQQISQEIEAIETDFKEIEKVEDAEKLSKKQLKQLKDSTKQEKKQLKKKIKEQKNTINEQKAKLKENLQALYEKHNIDCDKSPLIKVLLEPFSSKDIDMNTTAMKEKLKQIKELLYLFSSEDIDRNKANEAVDKHFNLIKSIIDPTTKTKITDDVYTQLQKQIYSIEAIDKEIDDIAKRDKEIDDIAKLLQREEVKNDKKLIEQIKQNLKNKKELSEKLKPNADNLNTLKTKLTEATKAGPKIQDLIKELKNLEQTENDDQIVTDISKIKNIREEFERGFYSIQSIADAINNIKELLDELLDNNDGQTNDYIEQVRKTLKRLDTFKQNLTEVSKCMTLDWDKIFGVLPTEKLDISTIPDTKKSALVTVIEGCVEKPKYALNNIKKVIYKIKQIQTNTNTENETNKNQTDKLITEIAKSYNTKEGLQDLLKKIRQIAIPYLTSNNDMYDRRIITLVREIGNYILQSQTTLNNQIENMLSFYTPNTEQDRETQHRKELPKQLLNYINEIHNQPCQMYKKFHIIQEKISILNAIKQEVLTPVPYNFINSSISELIKQINQKQQKTEIDNSVVKLLKGMLVICEAPTTWREIKKQIIDEKSKIENLYNTGKTTTSLLSKLINNIEKYSIQKIYDETEDPQIKKILGPLDLNNAKFCDITHRQLTWSINESLQRLQTFLDTKKVLSSMSTLTDIVKDAQLFPKKLNIQLAQIYSKKIEENNKKNTQNKNLDVKENNKENNIQHDDLDVEENNKENEQNKNLDPKTFYLQSIQIVAQNIKDKRLSQDICKDITNAIGRKYKSYVGEKFPTCIKDYNNEIKKCQESLKQISECTSDDTERQVFKMYYYRQMFLQQQQLAQSLDLKTFMSYFTENLKNPKLANSEFFIDVCKTLHDMIIPPQYKEFIENSKKHWHKCPKPEQIVDLALHTLNKIFEQINDVRNGLQALQSNPTISIDKTTRKIKEYYEKLQKLSKKTEELNTLLDDIYADPNCDQKLQSRLDHFVFKPIKDAKKLLTPLQDTTKKYVDDYEHMQKVITYLNKISEYVGQKDINWLLTNINPDNQNLDNQLISQHIITKDDAIPLEKRPKLLKTLNDQMKETIRSSAASMMDKKLSPLITGKVLPLDCCLEHPSLSQTDLDNNKLSWNELKFKKRSYNDQYCLSKYEKDCIQNSKDSIHSTTTKTLINQLRTKETFNYVETLTKEINKNKKELTDAGFWMHNTGDIAKLLETDVLPLNLV